MSPRLLCIAPGLLLLAGGPSALGQRVQTFAAPWSQPAGKRTELTAPSVFTAPVVNRGTVKVTGTTVRFLAPYTELGTYESNSSTNYFTDLAVGPGGYLIGGAGDVFIVSGSFTNASTQNTLWSTAATELQFQAGAGPHTVTFAGADLGPSYAGFQNNFAWGTLRLAAGQSLTLGDGNVTAGAAFYARRVILAGGIAQVASINGNNTHLYYDPTDAANAPLLAGAPGGVYPLGGGGTLEPVQVTVKITAITRLTNGHVLIRGLGTAGFAFTVQASPDLSGGAFASIGTTVADGNGNFSFEDVDAPSFPRRFYRLTFP